MMNGAVLRIVLFVACAHAMVHVYEVSLPSVEQEIAQEYFPNDAEAGKKFTGRLSNYWRLLWGVGALAAGWLVDRFGSSRMLTIYLIGCGVMCVAAGWTRSQSQLLPIMIGMGALAAIYHPAGLALISHSTTPDTQPRALGIHGIFGSLGIGAAPILAWVMLSSGFTWRAFYWALAVPGFLLGLAFVIVSRRMNALSLIDERTASQKAADDSADWGSYGTLVIYSFLMGFVYSALVSFLPRYLSAAGIELFHSSSENTGKLLASCTLWIGCVGQFLAGRYARAKVLELQLMWITVGNVPFLLWMAVAEGWQRAMAAAGLALVHFMQQPVYNSLIAKYSPRHRRSLCYGVSFAMAFGMGSFGASFAGQTQSNRIIYGSLACMAALGSVISLILHIRNRRHGDREAKS